MAQGSIGQKADYVRGELRKAHGTRHTCHWPGCSRVVSPAVWGCRPHWYKLPHWLRTKIWHAFRAGQEISKTPSREYLAVARETQDWINQNYPRALEYDL